MMRERPRQASYVERHLPTKEKVVNDKEPPQKDLRAIAISRDDANPPPLRAPPAKAAKDDLKFRVRAEPPKKEKKNKVPEDANPARIIKFMSIDDIPDGMPPSPSRKQQIKQDFDYPMPQSVEIKDVQVHHRFDNERQQRAIPKTMWSQQQPVEDAHFVAAPRIVPQQSKLMSSNGKMHAVDHDDIDDWDDDAIDQDQTPQRGKISDYDEGGYNDPVDDGFDDYIPMKERGYRAYDRDSQPTAKNQKGIGYASEKVKTPRENHQVDDNVRKFDGPFDGARESRVAVAPSTKKAVSAAVSSVRAAVPPVLPCESKPPALCADDGSLYFSKQPRAVEFKPYTLKQYKLIKPKEYQEISKIKPDLNSDELVAKRSNLERIKEFSKNLQKFNQDALSVQRKLPDGNEMSEIEIAKKKMESKREKAITFSKNIPKPKRRSEGVTGVTGGARDRAGQRPSDESCLDDFADDELGIKPTSENSKLQELAAKHLESKRQVDAIKRSMGMA